MLSSETRARVKGRLENLLTVIFIICIAVAIAKCELPEPSKEERAERARRVLADKKAGFHCLSRWDGSHRELVQRFKSLYLRDPDSFKHIRTRITPNRGGGHVLYMTYQARNMFGGTNVGYVTATVNNTTCHATIIDVSF